MRRTERGLWVPFPSSDLENPTLEQNAYPVDPAMQEVLSYSALLGPHGGSLARSDQNGNLLVNVQTAPAVTPVELLDPLGNFAATPTNPVIQRGGPPVLTNLIAGHTDTAAASFPDFTVPPCTQLVLILWVTAISGAGASISLTLQAKISNGTYIGTAATSTATGITTVAVLISSSQSGASAFLTPTMRIISVIAGTTPSITWGADMVVR